jgi:hypothetical protein
MGLILTGTQRLEPKELAQTFVALINQPKSAWTYELDLR